MSSLEHVLTERLGLTNHGLGVDPSDGESRLADADRALGDLPAE